MSFSAKISVMTLALLGFFVADLLGTVVSLKGGEGGAVNLPCALKRTAKERCAMLAATQKPADFSFVWQIAESDDGLNIALPENLHGGTMAFHGDGVSFVSGLADDALRISKASLEYCRSNDLKTIGIMVFTSAGYTVDLMIDLTPKTNFRVYSR